jgi:hypothetical protein
MALTEEQKKLVLAFLQSSANKNKLVKEVTTKEKN